MEDVLIPLGFFAAVTAIIWFVIRYRHRSYLVTSDTIKALIDKGESPTPELIKSLGIQPARKHTDLRVGLVLVAIAMATFFVSSVVTEREGKIIFSSIAMFPLLVGLVYTGLWFAFGRKEDA